MIRRVLLFAACSVVAMAGAPAPASAAVRDCSLRVQVHTRLAAIATVLNVRNMSCRGARRAVRRYGRSAGDEAFRRGGQFDLGPWSCTNYYAVEEHFKARCVDGRHAFRVDYGA